MRQLLHTFVHVSDMHFGEIDPRTGDAVVSRAADFAHQNFPLLHGLRGHQGRALEELHSFCDSLRDDGENFTVICSGDFTRCGARPEIDVAKTYFSSDVQLGAGRRRGLYLGKMPKAATSGNHDQWGGKEWPIGGGPLKPGTLIPRKLPYHFDDRLTDTRRILFAALDTDADIDPLSVKRGLAWGSFCSSLHDLDAQLLKRQSEGLASKDAVRVLLLHHSYAHQGNFLRMDLKSRQELEKFVVDHEFSVLLTGHMHESLLWPTSIRVGASRQPIRELRCGTSSQHDQFPMSWRRYVGKLYPLHLTQNCLIRHQIFREDEQLIWQAQVFDLTYLGFNKSQRHNTFDDFPL